MPARKHDYYQTLGVARDADADEIRKAYRKLARKHHPDLNPGDKAAEERFKKVQEAYDILSDPKKKQMYDQYGFYSENGFRRAARAAGRRGQPAARTWASAGSIFRSSSLAAGGRAGRRRRPGLGELFRNFQPVVRQRAGEDRASTAPEKGSDLEYGLNIDFWQAIRGTQVRLNITRQEVCATCGGTGARPAANHGLPGVQRQRQRDPDGGRDELQPDLPALRRHGPAEEKLPDLPRRRPHFDNETVEVRIPPGAQQGSRLRVAGKGNAGTHGRAGGRSLHHRARGAASVLPPRGRRYRDHGAGAVSTKPAWAPRSKCPPSTAGRCSRFRRAPRTGRNSGCAKKAC